MMRRNLLEASLKSFSAQRLCIRISDEGTGTPQTTPTPLVSHRVRAKSTNTPSANCLWMRNLYFPSLPVAVTYPDLSSLPYGNCRRVLNRESCRHMNFCLLISMNFDLLPGDCPGDPVRICLRDGTAPIFHL